MRLDITWNLAGIGKETKKMYIATHRNPGPYLLIKRAHYGMQQLGV